MIATVQAQNTARSQDVLAGYNFGSTYNKLWDSSTVTTINGAVTGKLTTPPMPGMGDGVTLTVKQSGKAAYEVQLGPAWFVNGISTQIKMGQQIAVTGSRVKIAGRQVILAQNIVVGKRDVFFRDKSGNPLWITTRMNTPAPTDVDYSGQIVGKGIRRIDGVDYNVYSVETASGTIDIVGEPAWLANRQTYAINVGYNVQVVGASRPAVQVGYNLFWADSIYTGGNVVVIRPPGWGY